MIYSHIIEKVFFVEPKYFANVESNIIEQSSTNMLNTHIRDVGIILEVLSVLSIEDGTLGDFNGYASFKVKLSLLVFKPQIDEEFKGYIKYITYNGIYLDFDPKEIKKELNKYKETLTLPLNEQISPAQDPIKTQESLEFNLPEIFVIQRNDKYKEGDKIKFRLTKASFVTQYVLIGKILNTIKVNKGDKKIKEIKEVKKDESKSNYESDFV